MDLGPKSPNNQFVKSELENQALSNWTNLQMVFCVKQMKKKKVCIEINRPRQYPRRSVLIYSFSVFLQDIFLSFLPCSLFFLYHPPPLSHSYSTRVYWRVGVDTCHICSSYQSPCSSCKAETHCSSITSTLMRPKSQHQCI